MASSVCASSLLTSLDGIEAGATGFLYSGKSSGLLMRQQPTTQRATEAAVMTYKNFGNYNVEGESTFM